MVVASGLLALVVGGAFAFVLLTITELRGTTDLRRQTREELVAADTLERQVIDLETGLRGFVITRDETFLQPANEARAALPLSARTLVRLAAGEPVQHARVLRIVGAVDAYVERYAVPLVGAVRRNDPSVRTVARNVAAKRRVDAVREGLESFRDAERVRLSARDEDVDVAARRATVAAAVGVAGSVVLIVVFSGYLIRVIVRPLRRAARMADRLAGGDLGARMDESDVAEIGALERSFNMMAGSLEVSRDELAALLAEQDALRRIATLVADGAAPTAVFDAVAAEMEKLLDADRVALNRYEPGAEVTVVAHRGAQSWRLPPGSRVSHDGQSVTALVRRTEQPARVEGFQHADGPIGELAHALGVNVSVGAPIVVDGRLWGTIVANWGGDKAPPADTEARMAKFAQLLDTAIANADSRDQLTASRTRLLTAADDARRRVVRDLHDGAQQRLVHTIITLKLAQRAFDDGDGDGTAEPLVREAHEQAELGNAELRELAHGILPEVLTRGGLRAAVNAIVARLDLPVDVDVGAERFGAEIEASAYFLVAEALTNVVKHAHARRAEVRTWVEGRTLRVEVRDDGIGGADPGGHGLLGMGDRLTALGGRLEVASPPGGGTVLTATLPLLAGRSAARAD
jgi:signal transduction histidine kinase